jgi:hypothetical protein
LLQQAKFFECVIFPVCAAMTRAVRVGAVQARASCHQTLTVVSVVFMTLATSSVMQHLLQSATESSLATPHLLLEQIMADPLLQPEQDLAIESNLSRPTLPILHGIDPLLTRNIPGQARIWRVKKGLAHFTSFSFWSEENFLCEFLTVITGQKGANHTKWSSVFTPDSWPNMKSIQDDRNTPVVVIAEVSALDIFEHSPLGTGNWLAALYGMRLAVLAASAGGGPRVDLLLHCTDASDQESRLVLPWVAGYFSSAWINDNLGQGDQPPNAFDQLAHTLHINALFGSVCAKYNKSPVALMIPFIRLELRSMAQTLLGQAAGHDYCPHDVYPPDNVLQVPRHRAHPLLAKVELDDVAIHFRCGDILVSNHPEYGFLKFSAFGRRIRALPAVQSIGIITQPFLQSNDMKESTSRGSNISAFQYRTRDVDLAPRTQCCERLVRAFAAYLEQQVNATVRVHNNAETETIALAYARLILAPIAAFSPISLFSVFPVLAATTNPSCNAQHRPYGFIRYPDARRAPNKWLVAPPVPHQLYCTQHADPQFCICGDRDCPSRLQLMRDGDRIMTFELTRLWRQAWEKNHSSAFEEVVQWFES